MPSLCRPRLSGTRWAVGHPIIVEEAPEAVLLREEAMRLRRFADVVMLIGGSLLLSMPWLGGTRPVKVGLYVSLALTFIVCMHYRQRLSVPGWYRAEKSLAFALPCVVSTWFAIAFFGLFSPAPAVAVLGIYFFGLSDSQITARVVFVSSLLPGVFGMFLLLAGACHQTGIIAADGLSPTRKLVVVAMVMAVLSATHYFARMSRSATLRVVRDLKDSERRVARQGAMLDEAKQALTMAARPGAGLHAGRTVGSWVVADLLGRGGMGDVYAAYHKPTGQVAAIKFLNAGAAANPEIVVRFRREADIMARLANQHVARIFDSGEYGGCPYIVMERLSGHTLAEILRKDGLLPHHELVEMLRQLASVLEVARQQGIVHRDIKPSNIFRAEYEGEVTWKVLDFGISRVLESPTQTQPQIIGTLAYMAPEQARGVPVDHRADVYSLAMVVYRALVGQPAFPIGDNPIELLHKVVHESPPLPSSVLTMPVGVDRAMLLAMQKDPAGRTPSVQRFYQDMSAALAA